ncbi:ribulose-phosphate 3-epimerase [Candidatus Peregrinibacteria bacterium]|nr:ribulose-phosphate 3-epimerase [Candidatus Peregrinibacteria bacterium]
MNIQVAPSILSADFGRLNEEIKEVEPYSDRLHYDVMDGHFVPNISFGAPVMKWIKTKLPIDVHLMIEHPWDFFEDFVKAGADTLIVHAEACKDLKGVLGTIRDLGVKNGVSVRPKTGVEVLEGVLEMVDQILIMTVEPGFGGQKFMKDMMPKIRQLRDLGYDGDISVDGGIDDKTARICREAGANIMIAGTYIFESDDRSVAIANLKNC